MKFRACSVSKPLIDRHRQHYCGTCKTIGALYGQKARLLLNHDAVFLAELLTALQPDSDEWDAGLNSLNCFVLPPQSNTPLALQAAASANVLLAEFKLRDFIADSGSGSLMWQSTKRLLSKEFETAASHMEKYGFALPDLWRWFDEQLTRERSTRPPVDLVSRLAFFSEPTARVTAAVFRTAAEVVAAGCQRSGRAMERFGESFGRLIYLIDAVEDRERDERRGHFNPLTIGVTAPNQEVALKAIIEKHYARAACALNALPIDAVLRANFNRRLRDNLRERLGASWFSPIAHSCQNQKSCCHRAEPQSVRSAFARAKRIMESDVTASRTGARSTVQAGTAACPPELTHIPFAVQPLRNLLMFLWIAFVTLCAPQQSEDLTSQQEYGELALNLIFWGTAFSAAGRAATHPVRASLRWFERARAIMIRSGFTTRGVDKAGGGLLPDDYQPYKPSKESDSEPGKAEPSPPDQAPGQGDPSQPGPDPGEQPEEIPLKLPNGDPDDAPGPRKDLPPAPEADPDSLPLQAPQEPDLPSTPKESPGTGNRPEKPYREPDLPEAPKLVPFDDESTPETVPAPAIVPTPSSEPEPEPHPKPGAEPDSKPGFKPEHQPGFGRKRRRRFHSPGDGSAGSQQPTIGGSQNSGNISSYESGSSCCETCCYIETWNCYQYACCRECLGCKAGRCCACLECCSDGGDCCYVCSSCSNCCSSCGSAAESCASCGTCGDCTAGCGNCGACASCGDCSACGGCGDCCGGCGACGDCSACGECCSGCSGCGDCCSGCSGCGDCCSGCSCS